MKQPSPVLMQLCGCSGGVEKTSPIGGIMGRVGSGFYMAVRSKQYYCELRSNAARVMKLTYLNE
jgi:hypothetical protein